MKKFSFFKRIYNSITCKKYDEMINQTSWYAIAYLALLELSFTLVISVIVAYNFTGKSMTAIYEYAKSFLVDFFYNSVSLTFDTILVVSILLYIFQILKKKKQKYSKMFCFVTYSSTAAMLCKYLLYIYEYISGHHFVYFMYIYFVILVIYLIFNYKRVEK